MGCVCIEEDDDKGCNAKSGVYTCTRYLHHTGDHIACGDGRMHRLHVWPQTLYISHLTIKVINNGLQRKVDATHSSNT